MFPLWFPFSWLHNTIQMALFSCWRDIILEMKRIMNYPIRRQDPDSLNNGIQDVQSSPITTSNHVCCRWRHILSHIEISKFRHGFSHKRLLAEKLNQNVFILILVDSVENSAQFMIVEHKYTNWQKETGNYTFISTSLFVDFFLNRRCTYLRY